MAEKRSRNEDLKEQSRYLRGTIAAGLEEAISGALAEDDTQLTKFHGTYQQDDRDLRPERRRKPPGRRPERPRGWRPTETSWPPRDPEQCNGGRDGHATERDV